MPANTYLMYYSIIYYKTIKTRLQNLGIGRPMFTTGNSIEITNGKPKEITTATSITTLRISNEQQTPSTALPVSQQIITSSSLGIEEQITTSTQVKSPTSTASTVRYHSTTLMAFKPMPSQSFQPHTNEGAIITPNPTQPTKQMTNKTSAPPVSPGIAIIATGKPKSNTGECRINQIVKLIKTFHLQPSYLVIPCWLLSS